jgi:hypothetical protein
MGNEVGSRALGQPRLALVERHLEAQGGEGGIARRRRRRLTGDRASEQLPVTVEAEPMPAAHDRAGGRSFERLLDDGARARRRPDRHAREPEVAAGDAHHSAEHGALEAVDPQRHGAPRTEHLDARPIDLPRHMKTRRRAGNFTELDRPRLDRTRARKRRRRLVAHSPPQPRDMERRHLGGGAPASRRLRLHPRSGTRTDRLKRGRVLGESRRHRIPAARHGEVTRKPRDDRCRHLSCRVDAACLSAVERSRRSWGGRAAPRAT